MLLSKTETTVLYLHKNLQIFKAILEKFQKQILPGIVANAIAGRNPFQMPPRQQHTQTTEEVRYHGRDTEASIKKPPFYLTPQVS